MCIDIFKGSLRVRVCVFLFGRQCHRNSEWVASNLELLIGLALPHVTEQVPAGLSDASCCSQHRLSGLCGDDITTFITPAWARSHTQACRNYLKQTSGSKIFPDKLHLFYWDTDENQNMQFNSVYGFVATGRMTSKSVQ